MSQTIPVNPLVGKGHTPRLQVIVRPADVRQAMFGASHTSCEVFRDAVSFATLDAKKGQVKLHNVVQDVGNAAEDRELLRLYEEK